MRLIVIGSASQREDLREQLENSVPDVVGEFASVADARAANVSADAYVVAAHADATAIDVGRLDDDSEAESLTPREIEVLELVAQGLGNKAIGLRLGISDQTVKFHLASISGKLGAANRTDAVRRAVRRGLMTL